MRPDAMNTMPESEQSRSHIHQRILNRLVLLCRTADSEEFCFLWRGKKGKPTAVLIIIHIFKWTTDSAQTEPGIDQRLINRTVSHFTCENDQRF